MTAKNELINIRRQLQNDLANHKKAVARIEGALKALDTVEELLTDERQTSMPGAGPYSDLGPEELALKIVHIDNRAWSIPEIIKEAERGGKDLSGYKSVYPVFYTALRRLVDKGEIKMMQRTKRESGEQKVIFFRGLDNHREEDVDEKAEVQKAE
jgi:hypothetical protein